MKRLPKILDRVTKQEAILVVLGFLLGALTNRYTTAFIISTIIMLFLLLIIYIYKEIKSRKEYQFSEWEKYLTRPDPATKAFMSAVNAEYLICGRVIEFCPHPNLQSLSSIAQLGWMPEEVKFLNLQEEFRTTELLAEAGGSREFNPPNKMKFCLVDKSIIIKDTEYCELTFRNTYYFVHKSIIPFIKYSLHNRIKYGNIDPTLNKIPHSFCLHYIARLNDGNVLCMLRNPKSDFSQNLWSFSGEEQLGIEDFSQEKPAVGFAQRAICEEIFPLRDGSPLEYRWNKVKDNIKSVKFWSIFIEEELINFSMLGVIQLDIDIADYKKKYTKLLSESMGGNDDEGYRCFTTYQDLLNLLKEGECLVKPIFTITDPDQKVTIKSLHPTSLYRVFRLLVAIDRKQLEYKFN